MAGWLSRLFQGNRPGPSAATRQFDAATEREGATAAASDAAYERDNAAFDPRAAFKEYSAGAMSDFSRNLALSLRDLKGSAVGAGRLDTAFFDEDQGQVVSDLGSRYLADVNQHALQTAGMRQGQIQYEGNRGTQRTQNYQDALAATLDRETAERNARRATRQGLIGGAVKLGAVALA